MEQLISIFAAATVGVVAARLVDRGIERAKKEIEVRKFMRAKNAEHSTKHQARRAFQCCK